jgi:signal peptidase II
MRDAGNAGTMHSASAPDPVSRPGRRWLWVSASVVAADQVSKLMVSSTVQLHEQIHVLAFLNITLMHNTGAAFSFLHGAGGWQRWFFIVLALAVSTALSVWLWRMQGEAKMLPFALALVLGGALGNLIDRALLGHVVDFIQVHYGSWYFPAFNVADSAISIGAAMLLIDTFRTRPAE